ncbi:murein transglycosylase A [Pararhizobium haloflavum]|uniref:murein transglycosylase A n=1 Tax=Pararhizobium haloflavum TaxID=2037914 RepID=UPI000C18CD21|nr:murein transglycosylase A [Pararhizobium haloflavum]
MRLGLEPASFDDVPGWWEDDVAQAVPALLRCAVHLASGSKPYNVGSLGITPDDFADAFRALAAACPIDDRSARQFFCDHFQPARSAADTPSGFVTGYYEPEIEVADRKGGAFLYPFYRRPDDLASLDAQGDETGLASRGFAFAMKTDSGFAEYFDREAIDRGCLEGKGWELAWARDRIDVFFAHIQGSARLIHRDGRVQRIAYAAKTGHPFTAIGRVLIDQGELDGGTVTMQAIRDWLANHPERQDEILWRNRSYIFFRPTKGEGPIGAAKVPLSPGRSLAVDRHIHTFGMPVFVDAPRLTHVGNDRAFQRLLIAQDTGSAIIGPSRGDIFIGSGRDAGDIAGAIKHSADFYLLLPKRAAARCLP